ncbi:MAG TPA: ABC transporter permease [Pyrinomonadaceae bacterium]|nr:ABC transporter permease [Pyrinomonadaceae bacterium]
MLSTIWQNFRYSARMLWKSPTFTVVAVLTLALGIGANATIFSFINGLLIRPIPGVERPERLVGIYTSDYSSGPYGGSSYPDYLDLREQATVFADLAAYDSLPVTLSGVEMPERLRAGLVSTNYFQLLGVRAQLGRTIRAEDDTPNASATVVLSHEFWQRHFGGDSSVIGRTLTLSDKAYTIVGVTDKSFHDLRLGGPPEVWLRLDAGADERLRGNRGIGVIGRLRDGVSLPQAQAQVTTIADRLARAYPETNMGTLAQPNSPRPIIVVPEERLEPSAKNNVRRVSALLLIVVGLVLLIACANVANLFLARASSRRREIAIRLALGASRWRLICQLLMESILLALLGAVGGLVVAAWTAGLIVKFFSAKEAIGLDLSIDWRVLSFTFIVALLSGVLFGLTPALQVSSPALVSSLKDEHRGSSLRLTRFGLRGVLVSTQIALSLLLLVGAGLFLRSLRNAITFDPGFDSRNLLFVSLATGESLGKAQVRGFYQELMDAVGSEPGVRSVSLTNIIPLGGGGQRRGIIIEGYQSQPDEDTELNTNVVGLNYFNTFGISVVSGRDFNSADREGSPGVVVVNEEFAQRYFRGQNAVGKRLKTDSEGPFLEIIGVVRTARYRNLRESPLPFVYLPLAQEMQGNMTLVVSTSGDPSNLRANVRSAVHHVNRNVPISSMKTISEQIDVALSADRMLALLLGVFGAAALLLASVGIYGVVSYTVAQRTHEIGIRMALGARSLDVQRQVLREGMTMAVAGVVVGLAGAFALTRLIASLLFGIAPNDLATFGMVTLGLLLIALIACYIPATRATKVDPLVALRYE